MALHGAAVKKGFLAETNLRYPWRLVTGYADSGCDTECYRRRFKREKRLSDCPGIKRHRRCLYPGNVNFPREL